MSKQIDEQRFLRSAAQGQTTASIGDAMADLNRANITVDLDGTIQVDGQRVPLRVRNGTVVALVDNVAVPWRLFRTTLRRKAA
jgi:hypothetical protein